MKLKFINADEITSRAKATAHTSGKLGFSKDAIDYLNIKEGCSIQFAQNEDDENDLNLYAIVHEDIKEGAFRILKAGEYFYVNTKNLFDTIGVDYRSKRIIYDIVKGEYEGNKIVKLLRREITKKKKGMPTQ